MFKADQLKIIKVNSASEASQALADSINERLSAGQTVLWLLSGGSAVTIAAQSWPLLKIPDPARLIVGQIDERFGPLDHPDSNWLALTRAGLDWDQATAVPILRGQDEVSATTKNYDQRIAAAIHAADFCVGLLGIGTNGHTAGILPHSQAVFEHETLVTHYQGPDFNRITITPKALKLLDQAAVYVRGAVKQPLVSQLQTKIDPSEQPAQLLKLAKQVIVYNNPYD